MRLVLPFAEYNEAVIPGTQVSYDVNSYKLKVIERLSSRNVVLHPEKSPATVLTHCNEDLTPQLSEGRYTTGSLGVALRGAGMRTSH